MSLFCILLLLLALLRKCAHALLYVCVCVCVCVLTTAQLSLTDLLTRSLSVSLSLSARWAHSLADPDSISSSSSSSSSHRLCILYESQTGCTEQMAKLIEEGAKQIPNTEIRVRSVHDASAPEDVKWADGLAVGTPTNLGGISWRMKKFWDDWAAENWDKVDGKICCTFSSQGGHGGGAEITCMAMNAVLMNFGFMVFGVTDYVDKIHTLHYGAVVAKQPRNQYDKDACRRLGLRLAEWIAVYFDGKKELHPLLTTKKQDKAHSSSDSKSGDAAKTASSDKNEATEAKAAEAPKPAAQSTSTPRPHVPTAETHRDQRVQLVVRASVPWRNQVQWKAMVKELELASRAEPGCINYAFGQIEGSETEFFVLEEYKTVADLERHSNSEHFTRLVPAMGRVSSTLSVQKVFPLHPQPLAARGSVVPAVLGGVVAGAALATLAHLWLNKN
ncbi:uncharacterized protein MONBRDRAFT_33673 [Monosiga brevicollis MX1]|uniref:Flavodoxin-like domain-containing protein n=1 Tax=Monosiga brevicollis TaxID=81824 RepID=A9V6H6_MONBE|nr:uncharacterized protein MONBRDRAFT_33673 [Monosiga brevicollis MX1]EDQ86885.1 predicted protein [Monosiga brevicollis MX1]|eukprot:XP_001748430.1 hypothetical protein [Monosiga brevicollis MX1]